MKLLEATFLFAAGSVFAAPDFHKDVAPILREYCAGCHNDVDLEGEFSVETSKSLMKGGENGSGIQPGTADNSVLVQQLIKQKKPYMPPRKEPQLTAEHIATLKEWINGGVKGPAIDRSILLTLTVPKTAAARLSKLPITAMAVSCGGVRTVGLFGKVQVGKRFLTGHPGKVNAIAFSPNGNFLAAASGVTGLRGEAVLWNLKTGRRARIFSEGHRDTLYGVSFSPEGDTISTAGYDRLIKLWDIKTGKLLRTLEGHNGAVHGIAFSPNGNVIASAGGDSSVKLWNTTTGLRLDTFGQPTGEQFNVAFTPDSQHIIAAGADKQIRLWRWISMDKPQINPLVRVRFAHKDEITDIAINPAGTKIASASADRTVKVWSLPDLKLLQTFADQSDVVSALAFSPNGRSLHVGRMDGTTQHLKLISAQPQTAVAQSQTLRAIANTKQTELTEREPNNERETAMIVKVPAKITGVIHGNSAADSDLFRFAAKTGEQWVIEINTARSKSPLDSKVEVLDAAGNPIERVRLQAVRESWLTFRGKDSTTSGDFRLFKWDEMRLNQLLYVNGEIVKLWHYPRGPDSGYLVYPGIGSRHTFFDTTPLAHPLGQSAYIVEPLAKGSDPVANGLPVFTVYFENDDESTRRLGKDSKLTFTTPADGDYLMRVSDIRGFQGETFKYTLTVRPRRPNFSVKLDGFSDGVPKGAGREFSVTAQRQDNYSGPIRVDISDVPKGFHVTTPLVIERGQIRAFGAIYANADAPMPGNGKILAKVSANATINGKAVRHPVNDLTNIELLAKPKLLIRVAPAKGQPAQESSNTKPLEFVIAPGETISARVIIERNGFKGRVSFGNHDSGRNLPHGVYVDNIGLSGLLIVDGQNEREFFITADKWVPVTTRWFHIRTTAEKGIASLPIILPVRKK